MSPNLLLSAIHEKQLFGLTGNMLIKSETTAGLTTNPIGHFKCSLCLACHLTMEIKEFKHTSSDVTKRLIPFSNYNYKFI